MTVSAPNERLRRVSRQTVFTWGAEFVTRVRELCDDTRTITGELVMPNLDDKTE